MTTRKVQSEITTMPSRIEKSQILAVRGAAITIESNTDPMAAVPIRFSLLDDQGRPAAVTLSVSDAEYLSRLLAQHAARVSD